jgi:hypothetical protein
MPGNNTCDVHLPSPYYSPPNFPLTSIATAQASQAGCIQVQTSIQAVSEKWRTGSYHSLAQILIDGCTIHEVGGAALTGRDVRGLEVRNCQFGSVGIAGHLLPLPFQRAGQSLLYFDQAGDISILNNAMLPGGSWNWQGTGDQQGLNMHGTYSKSGNTGF